MSLISRTVHQRMMDTLIYIQKNLDRQLIPEELAGIACYSVPHFLRLFKAMTGETLKEHIRRLRLEKAACRLIFTDESVMNTALYAGYESPETFSRAFKKMFGKSPSEYRVTTKEALLPSVESNIHYAPNPGTGAIKFTEDPLSIDINIVHREDVPVIFLRHIGSYFDVGEVWEELCSIAASKDLLNDRNEFIGLCYDDPAITSAEHTRYDACITIDHEIEPDGYDRLGVQTIAGGKFAVATHIGPYDGLEHSYKQLFGRWFPTSGYELRDTISFEKYVKTPYESEPEDFITEIFIGIK